MPPFVEILGQRLGGTAPCLIVAELGANHNGDLGTAIEMMRQAKAAGANLAKFQMRTPRLSIPQAQQDQLRETPWGPMSYLQYRERLEFTQPQWDDLADMARGILPWFASPWDLPSLERLLRYDPPCLKVASACLTDLELLTAMRHTGKPIIASTGMSDEAQITRAVSILGPDRLILLHCTSTYPAPANELNLQVMPWLRERFHVPVGFSGHHQGIWDGLCAAVMGACVVEKHFTLDRTAFGTDQAASLEPGGFARMARYIRRWETARGDGIKRVYDSERPVMARLRRVP